MGQKFMPLPAWPILGNLDTIVHLGSRELTAHMKVLVLVNGQWCLVPPLLAYSSFLHIYACICRYFNLGHTGCLTNMAAIRSLSNQRLPPPHFLLGALCSANYSVTATRNIPHLAGLVPRRLVHQTHLHALVKSLGLLLRVCRDS